jgi:arylsulfatase A-like enzyme
MLINSLRNRFDLNYPRSFMWDILKEENYTTAYISSQDDDWADMGNYYNKETIDFYSHSLTDGEWDYGKGNARKDYDEVTTNKILDWFDNTVENEESFYLYVNFQATHYPYQYPEGNSLFLPDTPSSSTSYFKIGRGESEESINDYDNSISYVDKEVGRILDYLEDEGLFENTIVVIAADHGEILERRHGNLRHGFGVYEEEVRTPLFIRIPGQEHKVINDRVRQLDVVPTLLDISGFDQSEDFQGKPMTANRKIFLMAQNQNFKFGMIKGDVKYVLDGFSYVPEAYNLTEDPLEQNNLIRSPKLQEEYHVEYGSELYRWYKCQMQYYKNKLWEKGERNLCP